VTQTNKQRPLTPSQAARRRTDLDRCLDAAFFKALGDSTRLHLVACLAKCGRASSVGEIAECCSVDLSVVSRHLALLAREGILESRREGRTVTYAVRRAELSALLRALADALDGCCPDDDVPAPSRACC
jgi:ArsR family transcriptional regulator